MQYNNRSRTCQNSVGEQNNINNSVTSFIERQINFVEHAFKIKNTLSPFQIFYFHLSITEISWMDKKVIFSLLAVLSKSIRVRKVKVD